MRMINFAKRNFMELIRDPLSLIFEIALPLFLLFIFQQFDIPAENYRLENFTPSIILFGFSFISLFTATLIAKDRTSSFLIRLGTSPMKSSDYILGYILSLLPIVLIQNVLFFITAIVLGLEFSISIIPTILVSMVISIFFIMPTSMWPPLGNHNAHRQHIHQLKICRFVSAYYSIGLIRDSIYLISSSLNSYFLYKSSSFQG